MVPNPRHFFIEGNASLPAHDVLTQDLCWGSRGNVSVEVYGYGLRKGL